MVWSFHHAVACGGSLLARAGVAHVRSTAPGIEGQVPENVECPGSPGLVRGDAGAVGILRVSVSFWLFGGSYGLSGNMPCSVTATEYGWICSWNTTGVPSGSYALLSVTSGVGGSAYSSGVSITVKN
jgi:hypothetical protein